MAKYPVHPDLKKISGAAFPMNRAGLAAVNALTNLGVRAFRYPKDVKRAGCLFQTGLAA